MKKFNVEIESETNFHCFSFEATNMQSAFERLKTLNLNCIKIVELPEDLKGKIRVPEEMYSKMKTKLPESIQTIEQAKAFLLELHTNGEVFHPEDDANDLHGYPFTKEEGDQLNKLMADIYNLEGNDGRHIDLKFDPCAYLISIDHNYHMLEEHMFINSELFDNVLLGDYQGEGIEYTIEGSAASSEGYEYTLTLMQDGSIIDEYVYDNKADAEADVLAMQELAGIELTEA